MQCYAPLMTKCLSCKDNESVGFFSPDLDIAPVPLCEICSMVVFGIVPAELAPSKSVAKRLAFQREDRDHE